MEKKGGVIAGDRETANYYVTQAANLRVIAQPEMELGSVAW